MSFEFSKVSLKQISSKIGDGIHGTPIYDENGSYYFINGNNLGSGRIVITSSTKKVGRNEYLKHKKELNESTVLLSINGTIGNVALYDDEPVILGKSACYINILPDVSVRYIGYVLKDRPFQHYIKQQANGSTIKNVSLKLIRDYEFTLPPKVVQDRIAEILSSLDKKISVNENMNIILEQMAQALFKSWFVDFEPVKAKMTVLEAGGSQEDATRAAMTAISGKDAHALAVFEREHPEQYAELKTTAELFPSAMQDSELGEIPVGWMVNSTSEHYSISIGKTPPRKEAQWFSINSEDLKWVSIKDMGIASTYISETSERLTHEAVKKFNIKVMPANTVFLSFKLTVGRVCITTEEMCSNEAIAHFTPKENKYESHWLYHALKSFNFNKLGSTSSIATAVNSKTIKEMKLIFPNKIIAKKFTKKVSSIMKLQQLNSEEINGLTELRDTLLPKLLSGEITLPEAEQIISEEA